MRADLKSSRTTGAVLADGDALAVLDAAALPSAVQRAIEELDTLARANAAALEELERRALAPDPMATPETEVSR